jgi:hypothetical protein
MRDEDSQIRVLTYSNISRYAAAPGLKQARRPFATCELECYTSLPKDLSDATQMSLKKQVSLKENIRAYVQSCTSKRRLPVTMLQTKMSAKGQMVSLLILIHGM